MVGEGKRVRENQRDRDRSLRGSGGRRSTMVSSRARHSPCTPQAVLLSVPGGGGESMVGLGVRGGVRR